MQSKPMTDGGTECLAGVFGGRCTLADKGTAGDNHNPDVNHLPDDGKGLEPGFIWIKKVRMLPGEQVPWNLDPGEGNWLGHVPGSILAFDTNEGSAVPEGWEEWKPCSQQ